MHEKGPDKGHIGDKYSFLLLTPVSNSNNLINEKNMIYLNFMNNINPKLSKVGFCNMNQKLFTFIEYDLLSFESDQLSVVSGR